MNIQLPPKSSPTEPLKDREYRTALRRDLYLKLELEAQERGGITPYKLTQIIMTLYLEGRLVCMDELPDGYTGEHTNDS